MHEMMSDEGPVPMDLENVGTHGTKMTQNDSETTNDISYEDVAPMPGKDTRPAREQARRDRMDQEHGIVGKELMNGRAAGDDGGKKGGKTGSKGGKPDWHSDKDEGSKGKRKGKGKGKSETRYCHDCGEQGHLGVNCPCKWPSSID